MPRRWLTIATALLAMLPALRAAEADNLWTTDFEAAKTQAKAEKKLLLVDFTGSDWCGWCMKLKAEVFDKDTFKAAAPKQFVLVELDFPNKKVLSAELKAQNAKLQKQFNVHGFPTILLLDADGQLVAQTGYRPGGPDSYLTHLGELSTAKAKAVELKAKADAATGIERAKLLDQMVAQYDILDSGKAEIAAAAKEIVTLDADNAAGLKLKYQFRGAMDAAKELSGARKFAEAKAAFEQVLAMPGLTPEQQQQVLYEEGACYFYLKDYIGVVETLKKAVALAPDTKLAGDLKGMIKRFQPEADKQAAAAKK